MITIANFSHPLSQAAKEYMDRMYAAGGGLHIIDVPVQIDTDKPLAGQVEALVAVAVSQANNNAADIDMFIPPGLNFAAVFLPALLPTAHMIVMARVGTPPTFMPVQVVRSREMKGRLRFPTPPTFVPVQVVQVWEGKEDSDELGGRVFSRVWRGVFGGVDGCSCVAGGCGGGCLAAGDDLFLGAGGEQRQPAGEPASATSAESFGDGGRGDGEKCGGVAIRGRECSLASHVEYSV